jgi:predicted RNase H-like HicB family nuclease
MLDLKFKMQKGCYMKIPYYIERDPETGVYVAIAPSIPGAHTQADTLDELRENLKEVIELCLEELAPRFLSASGWKNDNCSPS